MNILKRRKVQRVLVALGVLLGLVGVVWAVATTGLYCDPGQANCDNAPFGDNSKYDTAIYDTAVHTWTLQINADADDATQTTTGALSTSGPLVVGKDGSNTPLVGLRFPDVGIGSGYVVLDARLKLRQKGSTNGEARLEVFTEDGAGDLDPFGGSYDKPTTRLQEKLPNENYPIDGTWQSYCEDDAAVYGSGDYCGLFVSWVVSGTHSDGYEFVSPNLAVVVQEAVGRGDWAGGSDDVVLLIRSRADSPGKREFYDYGQSSSLAATLVITAVHKNWPHRTDYEYGARLPWGVHSHNNWQNYDAYVLTELDNMGVGSMQLDAKTYGTTDADTWLSSRDYIYAVSGIGSEEGHVCQDTDVLNYGPNGSQTAEDGVGAALGSAYHDCYTDAQTWANDWDYIDLARSAPSNEEDTFDTDCDGSTNVGKGWAGPGVNDMTCDSDPYLDPLEYVDFVARGYIGVYKAKMGVVPVGSMNITYDVKTRAYNWVKWVMDMGLGSFMDVALVHYYPTSSCWFSVHDKLYSYVATPRNSGNAAFCDNVPPSGASDAWGYDPFLRNQPYGGKTYSDGYAGYVGGLRKYLGFTEVGDTACAKVDTSPPIDPNCANQSSVDDSQAEQARYLTEHFAAALADQVEFVNWFTLAAVDNDHVMCPFALRCGDPSASNNRPAYYAAWSFKHLNGTKTVEPIPASRQAAELGADTVSGTWEVYEFDTGSQVYYVLWLQSASGYIDWNKAALEMIPADKAKDTAVSHNPVSDGTPPAFGTCNRDAGCGSYSWPDYQDQGGGSGIYRFQPSQEKPVILKKP